MSNNPARIQDGAGVPITSESPATGKRGLHVVDVAGNASLESIDDKLPALISSRVPVDSHLSDALDYTIDSVKVWLVSQLPAGATPVRVAIDSAAGATVTATMPAVAGKINYVLGYFANVDVAATTAITTAILKDDTTAMGTKVLPAAAPVGAEVGTTPSNGPIMAATIGKAANLVVSAPGGTTVIHACIWGYVV